jgi:signal transduction histidine kinase
MRLNLRQNALIIVSAIAFLAAAVLSSILLDNYYTRAKVVIIRGEYLPERPIYKAADFNNLVGGYLEYLGREPLPPAELLLRQQREKAILQVVDAEMQPANSPMVGMELIHDGEVVLSRRHPERAARLNNWRNSFLTRSFEARIVQRLQDPTRPKASDDRIVFIFASPVGYPPVERLTQRYWLYLAGLLGALAGLYVLILRFVILPIRRVAEAIQASRGGAPRFIATPRMGLEVLYNRMARDAALNALRIGFQEPGSGRLRLTLTELLERLAPRIREWFGFDRVALLELSWARPDRLEAVRQMPPPARGEEPLWAEVGEAFDAALARNLRTSAESRVARLFQRDVPSVRGAIFAGAIPQSKSEGADLRVLVLKPRGGWAASGGWYADTAQAIYEQVLGLVEQQGAQSRELMREKGEANISLSRNLGHDLTNIVATSKLELMTLGQMLRAEPQTWVDSFEKAGLIREAVERLLDNTRSLQEIVNLYRAYEYLKSPRYEPADMNRLVREIVGVFCLSMSAPVQVDLNLAEGLPVATVEPRLVKLALFNLMSNAQDAVRRLSHSRQAHGRILVQTLPSDDKKKVLVRVADNGPGIRTAADELASEEEILRVFELGFTTKPDGAGEGLGLNWVRTILTEFHDGTLRARNCPEGGAEFEFALACARPGK